MKILVINTGSSSIKYELFDMPHQRRIVSGLAEKIGEETGLLTHGRRIPGEVPVLKTVEAAIPDHVTGMHRIVDILIDAGHGAIRRRDDITAVGHRVVHGGERFQTTTVITKEVISAIRENIPLAPLHNPSNLTGIEVAAVLFPHAVQVAVFDTAFHQTLPMEAFLYAIPFEMYEEKRIRRYGFHGISHAYVAERAAAHMNRPLSELNLITIHLGNGTSMAAIKGGKCRELCCRGLSRLGIEMDPERNRASGSGLREISPPAGEVKVLIVPTDEALRIAQETQRVVENMRYEKRD